MNQVKIQQLHPEIGKMSKMKIGTIKANIPKTQPHDIPEVGKHQKLRTKVESTSTHNYNTISKTKRVNHVNTFKKALIFFPLEATEK